MLAHDSSPKGRAKALRAKWVSRQPAARMKCVPYGVRGRVKKPGGHLPSRLGRSLCPIQYAERKLATSRAVPNGLSVTDQLQGALPAAARRLQLQVGVGVQDVVLEDVAGLDGLHQAQVVGVDEFSRKYDRYDIIGYVR